MINLEQVKLLETKVAKTIEYVERLSKENAGLSQQESGWQAKLDASQKRVEELEVLETEWQAKLDTSQKRVEELEVLETELQTKLESYQTRIDELEVLITNFKEDQGQIEEGILSALDRLNQFEQAMEKTLRDKPADTKRKAKQAAVAAAAVAAEAPEAAEAAAVAAETAAAGSGEGQTCFEIPEEAAAENADAELDIF